MKHTIGSFFVRECEVYILAQVGHGEVALISLNTANRVNNGVQVDDIHKITFEEFNIISMGKEFRYIPKLTMKYEENFSRTEFYVLPNS